MCTKKYTDIDRNTFIYNHIHIILIYYSIHVHPREQIVQTIRRGSEIFTDRWGRDGQWKPVYWELNTEILRKGKLLVGFMGEVIQCTTEVRNLTIEHVVLPMTKAGCHESGTQGKSPKSVTRLLHLGRSCHGQLQWGTLGSFIIVNYPISHWSPLLTLRSYTYIYIYIFP